jgi:hypothetical protein
MPLALPPTEASAGSGCPECGSAAAQSLLGLSMSRFRIFGLECLANNFNLFIYSCDKFQFRKVKVCVDLQISCMRMHVLKLWLGKLCSIC